MKKKNEFFNSALKSNTFMTRQSTERRKLNEELNIFHLRCSTISMRWIPMDSTKALPDISLNFKKRCPAKQKILAKLMQFKHKQETLSHTLLLSQALFIYLFCM